MTTLPTTRLLRRISEMPRQCGVIVIQNTEVVSGFSSEPSELEELELELMAVRPEWGNQNQRIAIQDKQLEGTALRERFAEPKLPVRPEPRRRSRRVLR